MQLQDQPMCDGYNDKFSLYICQTLLSLVELVKQHIVTCYYSYDKEIWLSFNLIPFSAFRATMA